MDRDLEGKAALVTGGTRGIGKAVALALAVRGANVFINYRESEAAAADVVSEIEKHGVKAIARPSDMADPIACRRMIDGVVATFGRLDIVVNNAGIAHLQRLGDDSDWAAADRVWAVNTFGVVATIRAAANVMADGGRIITIGSVSGRKAGMAGSADYCGSKAAVAGYTRGAAHDLAPRKITVNLIESGMMNTDLAHAMPEADKIRIMTGIPLNRFGDLEEIAALVSYLTSRAGAYITGATLTIDGGFSA
ncbi:oxidoreductase [Paraburkholderia rhynchosiae]|uniref:Oxidoreductase n=1 Tax=Paraburkholderia rhynchosiae TaxID=487049 RepID=A0ABX4UW28_9BURK|nr:oxidoreductase [Paraburkholderia rhynchosiae]